MTSQTENELIKHFNTKTSIDLFYRFGTGTISNTEIKDFVHFKKRGWYQSIRNKIYGQNSKKNYEKIQKNLLSLMMIKKYWIIKEQSAVIQFLET